MIRWLNKVFVRGNDESRDFNRFRGGSTTRRLCFRGCDVYGWIRYSVGVPGTRQGIAVVVLDSRLL